MLVLASCFMVGFVLEGDEPEGRDHRYRYRHKAFESDEKAATD